jgi:hypothetical protein
VARLIAALQSLARRPALLGLVRPGATAALVHVRAAVTWRRGRIMTLLSANKLNSR